MATHPLTRVRRGGDDENPGEEDRGRARFPGHRDDHAQRGAGARRPDAVRGPRGDAGGELPPRAVARATGCSSRGSRRDGMLRPRDPLARGGRARRRRRSTGTSTIRLPSGRFVVAAQEGVDLVSGGDVSVVSGRVNVNAADGNVVLERLTFLGTFVRAEIEKIKLFAEHVDSVVDRVAQRVKRSYRTVEETDQVRAERIDYVAKKTREPARRERARHRRGAGQDRRRADPRRLR